MMIVNNDTLNIKPGFETAQQLYPGKIVEGAARSLKNGRL
jgi:hypothetical protein